MCLLQDSGPPSFQGLDSFKNHPICNIHTQSKACRRDVVHLSPEELSWAVPHPSQDLIHQPSLMSLKSEFPFCWSELLHRDRKLVMQPRKHPAQGGITTGYWLRFLGVPAEEDGSLRAGRWHIQVTDMEETVTRGQIREKGSLVGENGHFLWESRDRSCCVITICDTS